jgi:DNA mismatch repair protein MutL
MANKIVLLPDNVANQIAAGEVVQRPASAVKELLENGIDAQATQLHLNVLDAGKSLIQVIDNGVGMSETDIRMAFERHATSKITKAEDLFNLHTKGFRGEALASISAVAQVSCKSKIETEDLASEIKIEGNKVTEQGYTSGVKGTTISVKNLFFNIPARRNFLKSNQVEFKHIVDEFERVALAHPDIQFKLTHNQNEIFNLNSGNHRQRIVGIFGNKYNERLVPVEENTDLVKISGFILKPKFAKRTRGEQFFFVNNRFIKSPFLNRAVSDAFDGLIGGDQYPSYFLFMDVDPSKIDVNIHPTKTEIKFEDEHFIFAILKSAIKKSLGQFNVAPSIDFEADLQFHVPPPAADAVIRPPKIDIDPEYNPFKEETVLSTAEKRARGESLNVDQNDDWQKMFEGLEASTPELEQTTIASEGESVKQEPLLLQNKYILYSVKSGLTILNIKRALERIFFQEFITQFANHSALSQQLLFPVEVSLSTGDMKIIKEIIDDLTVLGFDISIGGPQLLVVNGTPIHILESDIKPSLEGLVESAKLENRDFEVEKHKHIAEQLAMRAANSHHTHMSKEEQSGLIDRLFACENPYLSLRGKPTLSQIDLNELDKYFN